MLATHSTNQVTSLAHHPPPFSEIGPHCVALARTRYLDQAGIKLIDTIASASRVLVLKVYAIITGLFFGLLRYGFIV